MLINHTMWSSNLFFFFLLFPAFFIVEVFQSPGFSGSRFFRVQVFQSTVFSGPRFFRVQIFQGPGFSGSGSRVWVQVLEVAVLFHMFNTDQDIKVIRFNFIFFLKRRVCFAIYLNDPIGLVRKLCGELD